MRIRNSELSNYIEPTQLRLLKSYSNRLNIKHGSGNPPLRGSAIYLPREFEGGTLADFLANAVKFISTNKDTITNIANSVGNIANTVGNVADNTSKVVDTISNVTAPQPRKAGKGFYVDDEL